MSSFEKALAYVLRNEAGFVNSPNDKGGPTNMGITRQTLATWKKVPLESISTHDIKTLSPGIAKFIYKDNYWFPLQLSALLNDSIATCIFDCAVLYGQRTAARMAQECIHLCTGEIIVADGHIGPITIEALDRMEPEQFINVLHGLIYDRIEQIVAANPMHEVHKKGWENRADKLLTLIQGSTKQ